MCPISCTTVPYGEPPLASKEPPIGPLPTPLGSIEMKAPVPGTPTLVSPTSDNVLFGNPAPAPLSLPRRKVKLVLSASAASENVMFASADHSASADLNPFF